MTTYEFRLLREMLLASIECLRDDVTANEIAVQVGRSTPPRAIGTYLAALRRRGLVSYDVGRRRWRLTTRALEILNA